MLWLIESFLTGFENNYILEEIVDYTSSNYLYSFYNIIYLFIFNVNTLFFIVLFPLFINFVLFAPLFLFDKIFHTNSKQIQIYITKLISNFIKENYNYIEILLKYFTILSIFSSIYFLYKISVYKINKTKLKLQKIIY
jgi:hypothetical protein